MGDRVVITGIGAVTGFGEGVDALWEGLEAGSSAIVPLGEGGAGLYDASGFASRLAGVARGFDVRSWVPKSYRKATKVMARDIELAVGAAAMAVADAGIVTRADAEGREPTYAAGALGCNIGAGLISAEAPEMALASSNSTGEDGGFSLEAWGERGLANLQPLWLLKYLPNMLACHVTIIHGAEGPSNTITCAEASGLLSLGESMRVIGRGDARASLSGGGESKINLTAHARMEKIGRVAPTGDATDAEGIVKPFDPTSAGTVLGEGAGILVVEALKSARARGAGSMVELAGFGAAQSLPDFARDDDDDEGCRGMEGWDGERGAETGLVLAIHAALKDAGVGPEDVAAIVPHGSGYAPGDQAERAALEAVFGPGAGGRPIVAWAHRLGDCLAGNGGVQVAIGASCVRRGRVPSHLVLESDGGVRGAGPADLGDGAVLVCTNSMGGQNAAVVLRRME